jgi:HEAT repeat protein
MLWLWLGLGALALLLVCGGVFTIGVMAYRTGRKATQNMARMVTPPATTQEALQDLQGGDFFRTSLALDYLQRIQPDPALQPQIARELERLASSQDVESGRAAEALVNWATPEQVPALIELSDKNDHFVANSARKALVRLKDPRGIPAVAKGLTDLSSRHDAAEGLIELGGAAEGETLKYIDHSDTFVRMEACRVMKKIGTAKSLPELEKRLTKLQGKRSAETRSQASQLKDVIDTIKDRGKD